MRSRKKEIKLKREESKAQSASSKTKDEQKVDV